MVSNLGNPCPRMALNKKGEISPLKQRWLSCPVSKTQLPTIALLWILKNTSSDVC